MRVESKIQEKKIKLIKKGEFVEDKGYTKFPIYSFGNSDESKTWYVLGIMGNVSQLYALYGNEELYNTDNQEVNLKKKKKKKKDNTENEDDEPVITELRKGKIIPAKDIDKTMMRNFTMCSGMDYFKHEVEEDE